MTHSLLTSQGSAFAGSWDLELSQAPNPDTLPADKGILNWFLHHQAKHLSLKKFLRGPNKPPELTLHRWEFPLRNLNRSFMTFILLNHTPQMASRKLMWKAYSKILRVALSWPGEGLGAVLDGLSGKAWRVHTTHGPACPPSRPLKGKHIRKQAHTGQTHTPRLSSNARLSVQQGNVVHSLCSKQPCFTNRPRFTTKMDNEHLSEK